MDRRQLLMTGAATLFADAARAEDTKTRPTAGDAAATRLGPKFVVLGAWCQDPASMPTWAARGINTQFTEADDFAGGDGPAWRRACRANKQWMVLKATHGYDRGASNSYLADENDPLVIAHLLYDEPDLTGPSPAVMNAEVAAARALGSAKPFFVNFRNQMTGIAYTSLNPGQFVNLQAADWVSSDNYAYQGQEVYIFGDRYAEDGFVGPFTTMSGHATRVLNAGPLHKAPITYPGRATFQFLATGRIYDGAPGGRPWPRMTALQYGIQAWSCIVNGASGLIHFAHYRAGAPDQISDDTSPELERGIANLVAKLAVLEGQAGGNVLMDTTLGGRRRFTLRPCTNSEGGGQWDWPANQPNFGKTSGLQLPPWFEGAEIPVGGETYRLVLNLHDSLPKSLTDGAWGLANSSFRAGQVKCFKASAPSVDIFA